jgi:hypothetical protein
MRFQIAALDDGEQVLQRAVVGGDGNEIGAELAPGHAAWIRNTFRTVEMPGFIVELDERAPAARGKGFAP